MDSTRIPWTSTVSWLSELSKYLIKALTPRTSMPHQNSWDSMIKSPWTSEAFVNFLILLSSPALKALKKKCSIWITTIMVKDYLISSFILPLQKIKMPVNIHLLTLSGACTRTFYPRNSKCATSWTRSSRIYRKSTKKWWKNSMTRRITQAEAQPLPLLPLKLSKKSKLIIKLKLPNSQTKTLRSNKKSMRKRSLKKVHLQRVNQMIQAQKVTERRRKTRIGQADRKAGQEATGRTRRARTKQRRSRRTKKIGTERTSIRINQRGRADPETDRERRISLRRDAVDRLDCDYEWKINDYWFL